nr:YtxH domain-containing protein [Oscillochloris sp. ZM17-4]
MLLGALAGAAAAALLAPRSGAATRELLRERGLELKDRAEEMLRSRRSPL